MKKKLLAMGLALVMIITNLGSMAVSAADNDSEVLATDVSGGTFTDETADADTAYEYTITGSDGSTQTVVVPAATDETGNTVTGPHTGVAGVYYELVTDLLNGISEGIYLLVADDVAVTNIVPQYTYYALSADSVTVEGNRINTVNGNLEWIVSGSNGAYSFRASDGKYLNITYESLLSENQRNIAVEITDNTIVLKDINNECVLYCDNSYNEVYANYADEQSTYFSLYRKMEDTGSDYYKVDTTGLNALIEQYSSLNSKNYTAGSWAAFQNAMNAAKALQNLAERFETAEAAQAKLNEVNTAQANLIIAYENLEQLEVQYPEISWTRTQDNTDQAVYVERFSNSDGATSYEGVTYEQYTALTWEWNELDKLIKDQETKQDEVWDYTENDDISAAYIETGVGGWEDAYVHKISGTFEWPEGYDLNETTITLQSVNDEHYQPIYDYIEDNGLSEQFPNGRVFPVNDDVYVMMWVEDENTNVTSDNINDYLLFWTGTSGKGIWSENGNTNADWSRTTSATFLSASRQGVRAFHNSWPNAVGTSEGSGNNYSVVNMTGGISDYLKQSDGWYTLTDTTAINSIMRNNYPNGIAAGATVHLDMYVFNNSSTGGIDELEISLAKQAQTETSVTVNYYYGSVTTPADENAFLGTTTLNNVPFGTEITLRNGVNAAQLNHMKAAAIAKAGGLVTDGEQQGTIPYVVQKGIDNVINVLYLPDGVESVTYTFDFGMTNVYTGVLDDNELKSVQSVELVDNNFNVSFDLDENKISFTPKAATTDRAMVTLKLNLGYGTIQNKVVYFVAASNVLYEENFFTTTEDSGWVQNGSAANVTITDNMSTVYGYTDSYKTSTNKNGAYDATVSADTRFTGDLNFKFSGTGFDLLSTCGPNTGTLMVRVNDGSGNYVKAYVVDTAFNDEAYGTINQVPLIHEQNLANGTYELVIRGAYINYSVSASTASTFGMRGGSSNAISDLYDLMYSMGLTDDQIDDVEFISVDTNSASTYALRSADIPKTTAASAEMNLNVDGIRVYLPTNNRAYVEGELGVTYYNVLDAVDGDNITAYIEADEGEYKVTDYELAGGPQNEIYLKKDQAVAFKVNGKNPVQVSLRNVDGEANAAIMGNDTTITHSTEMYYEVTPDTNGIVTVQNTGDGLLAICNLKFAAESTVEFLNEDDYPAVFTMLRRTSVEPEAPVLPECGGTSCEYTPIDEKEATCTEGGNVEHWYCQKHDRYYVMGDEGLTAANATDVLTNPDPYNHVGETELRNESDIYTGDLHCSQCGALLKKGETIKSETPETFRPEKLKTNISSISILGCKIVTLNVTASSDVKYITVNGKRVNYNVLLALFSRNRSFTVTSTYFGKAKVNYEIIAYNKDGVASKAMTVTR